MDAQEILTSQFPHPPHYFGVFAAGSAVIDPPDIPCDNSPDGQYGGCLTESFPHFAEYDEKKDYRGLLKATLDIILTVSLDILSEVPHKHPIEEMKSYLDTKLDEFHGLLSEYRSHEAREFACLHLENQLLKRQTLQEKMERLVQAVEAETTL